MKKMYVLVVASILLSVASCKKEQKIPDLEAQTSSEKVVNTTIAENSDSTKKIEETTIEGVSNEHKNLEENKETDTKDVKDNNSESTNTSKVVVKKIIKEDPVKAVTETVKEVVKEDVTEVVETVKEDIAVVKDEVKEVVSTPKPPAKPVEQKLTLAQKIAKGKKIFNGGICTACHDPKKKKIGPTLKTIGKTYIKKKKSIAKFLRGGVKPIVWPEKFVMMKPNIDDVTSKMPQGDLEALEAYITSLGK
jgi:cytochrome c